LDISFRTKKLREQCNQKKKLVSDYGAEAAKAIMLRLDDLAAAECLEDMRNLPGRCHELRGDKAGCLSIDLRGPYRLLFVPQDEPPPRKNDGGLDWRAVTAIEIQRVEDTHA